jgi:hypothetical protein
MITDTEHVLMLLDLAMTAAVLAGMVVLIVSASGAGFFWVYTRWWLADWRVLNGIFGGYSGHRGGYGAEWVWR